MGSSVSLERRNLVSARVPSRFKRGLTNVHLFRNTVYFSGLEEMQTKSRYLFTKFYTFLIPRSCATKVKGKRQNGKVHGFG
jgi:hypothetical protein